MSAVEEIVESGQTATAHVGGPEPGGAVVRVLAPAATSVMRVAEETAPAVALPASWEQARALSVTEIRDALRMAWKELLVDKATTEPWRMPTRVEVLTSLLPRAVVHVASRLPDSDETQLMAAELVIVMRAMLQLRNRGKFVWGAPLQEDFRAEWQRLEQPGAVDTGDAALRQSFQTRSREARSALIGHATELYYWDDWSEEVNALAAERGCCWLLLATQDVLNSLAEQDPVRFLDDLNTVRQLTASIDMMTAGKLDDHKRRLLAAFFRDT